MEIIKKQRRVFRTAFTRAFNAFSAKMESDGADEERIVAFQFLEGKMAELDTIHAAYNQALFDSEMNEADINKELESNDAYKTQFLVAKTRM